MCEMHGGIAIERVFDPVSDGTRRNTPGLSWRMISSKRSLDLHGALISIEDGSEVAAPRRRSETANSPLLCSQNLRHMCFGFFRPDITTPVASRLSKAGFLEEVVVYDSEDAG